MHNIVRSIVVLVLAIMTVTIGHTAAAANLDLTQHSQVNVKKLQVKKQLTLAKKGAIVQKGKAAVKVKDSLTVTKNASIRKNLDLRGNLHDKKADEVTVADDLVPSENGIYSLGNGDLLWNNLYVTNIFASSVDGVDVSALEGRVTTLEGADPFPAGCSNGQVAKYDGNSWECGDDIDTDTDTTYTAGDGLNLSGTQFSVSGLDSDDLSDVGSVAMLDESETISSDWNNYANPWADGEVADALTVDGGFINDTPIGTTTPADGTFDDLDTTTLNTDNLTVDSMGVEGLRYHDGIPFSTTTSALVTDDDVGNHTVIAKDLQGDPIVAHVDATNSELDLVMCDDWDCTSTSEVTIASSVDTTQNIDMALYRGSLNAKVFVYVASDDTLHFVHCNDSCSSVTDTDITPSGEDTFQALAMTMAPNGEAIISYFSDDSVQAGLRTIACNNFSCSSNTATLHETTSNITYTDIAVGVDGYPLIVYADESAEILYALHCTSADCSTADTKDLLEDRSGTDVVGEHISLTIDDNHLPVMAYYDAANGEIAVTQCSVVDCSSHTSTAIESGTYRYQSITIGDTGFPIVSYYDVANGNLKVAVCHNATCSRFTTSTAVVGTTIGLYSAITIRPDGKPIIAMHTDNGDDLYLYEGGNQMFINYWTRR